jgi:hypothetical protein
MNKFIDFNFKALVFGAAIAGAFILFGYQRWDWFYPFASIGLLYAGYGQSSLKLGTICGAIASTPIIILTLQGYMGQLNGFFLTETGIITITLIILIIGAFVGFVGAWTKRSRAKALEEYEKNPQAGKNKNKKKNKKNKNKKNKK